MNAIWRCVSVLASFCVLASTPSGAAIEIAGVTVTPHVKADSMRYRRDPEPAIGARVQLFLLNNRALDTDPLLFDANTRVLFEGKTPADLLATHAWAWHDTPSATPNESLALQPGAMTVWSFNGRVAPLVPNGQVRIEVGNEGAPWLSQHVALTPPSCWIQAVTFLAPDGAIHPNALVVHVTNASDAPVEIRQCRLWLPSDPKQPRALIAYPPIETITPFNGHATISPGEHGGFVARVAQLPLTYAAIEVELARAGGERLRIWAHLRIKPERFDISGGWVNDKQNHVASEVFLKALKRLYVNTAHLAITPGYSDTELYARFPLKYFNALTPFDTYDTNAMLARIHAVEFLGEPQYGGGHPVPPQQVWHALHPYATTRLATTVTHSEERTWRDYAGLSDFPHYDAYRVTAPSADAWRKYERWGKERIAWGAPLETIGDMCRALRELNRPMPCAMWAQGPHDGWEVYGGRKRTAPTPDEIRVQAYHAISTRITSLYWFNLSLGALVMWRDTLDELECIGRELRLLDDFLLEGDGTWHERVTRADGQLDWDLATVCGPRAALLFALDLDYAPNTKAKVFTFGPPRRAEWRFPLPVYLDGIADVFRIDAGGVYDVQWKQQRGGIVIRDSAMRVVVYVAARDPGLRADLERERQNLIAAEQALAFDPAHNDGDFAQLVALAQSK